MFCEGFFYYTSYASSLSADLCIMRHGSKQTETNPHDQKPLKTNL